MSAKWAELQSHHQDISRHRIATLFDDDSSRSETFSLVLDDLLFDFARTKTTQQTLRLLFELASEAGVEARRNAMFAGERINETEDRSVLHVALRNVKQHPFCVDGADVTEDVAQQLSRMRRFSAGVRDGTIVGSDGKPFTDVINIGIGGSDLGPRMVTQALKPFHDGPNLHFISNVDGAEINDTLQDLDPARCLFLISSKSFTTVETLTNARTAWEWCRAGVGDKNAGAHFAAISTALDKVGEFDISPDRVFSYWDWVGGRYSVWSAAGLPVMIAIGEAQFDAFLAGAQTMDDHFRTAPLAENIPVTMALLGIWHSNFCGYSARAVLPYDQRLARFPAYVQQLDMESNGKRTMLDGSIVTDRTGPIVWGEPGTNGQHAFFQLLHQGTETIPCEFLVAAEGHEPDLTHHHDLLLASCLAQSESLMRGRSEEETLALLHAQGLDDETANRLTPHRAFPGDRPSTLLLYRTLDPRTLGMLIALYEHRVFVEGCVWNINSFDQWGVELGKEQAKSLLSAVERTGEPPSVPNSLQRAVTHLRMLRRQT
ncbi:MAG: glucose-6-phosphate isomerase [Pseudomonadota bacterium]